MNNSYHGNGYIYKHKIDQAPNIDIFKYETHDDMHELYIFYSGHVNFCIEGSIHSLNPYDIVIVNNHELHKPYHIKPLMEYKRVVINFTKSFFAENNCIDLENIFTNRPIGVGNLIPAAQNKASNIHSIIRSIDEYIEGYKEIPDYIIKGKLLEILFCLKQLSDHTSSESTHTSKIKAIIEYINENITEDISPSHLAEAFHFNKQYLCRLFKKNTGMTVTEYVTHKKFILVRELYSNGISLTEASLQAGFATYSNFYKLYKKTTGRSPKEDMLKE